MTWGNRLGGRTVGLLLLGGLALSPTLAQTDPETPAQIDDAKPRVTVALNPSELTVGDRVTAVLTVTAPASETIGEPRFPEWRASWGSAEILEVVPPEALEPRGGVATFRQRLVLTSFRPGEVVLPPQEIQIPQTQGSTRVATPDDLAFHITPVLPSSEEPAETFPGGGGSGGTGTADGIGDPDGTGEDELEPKPEAPPRPLPLTGAFWGATTATASLCALLALLLWQRTRRAAPPTLPLTPMARLERELRALPGAASGAEGHAALSRALRHYLGERLGFPAPESTTSEIRRELGTRRLPDAVSTGSSEVLSACDLVKFAAGTSTPEGLRRHAGTARRVGRNLERFLVPAEPTEPHETNISSGPQGTDEPEGTEREGAR